MPLVTHYYRVWGGKKNADLVPFNSSHHFEAHNECIRNEDFKGFQRKVALELVNKWNRIGGGAYKFWIS